MVELPTPVVEPVLPTPPVADVSRESERPKTFIQVRGSFENIIDVKAKIQARKLSIALEKLYLIFRTSRDAWPRNSI